jgi:hypothetical protein
LPWRYPDNFYPFHNANSYVRGGNFLEILVSHMFIMSV